jgi:hypothetical protein
MALGQKGVRRIEQLRKALDAALACRQARRGLCLPPFGLWRLLFLRQTLAHSLVISDFPISRPRRLRQPASP